MLSQLKLLGIYQRELSKNHGCAGAALEAVAEAAVKDAVCDWCVSDSVMAGRIMNVFGRSHDPSLEPAADPFRDKIAAMIYQHRNAVKDAVGGEEPTRDWPEAADPMRENIYQNRCVECSQIFMGWKRRLVCAVCARPQASAAVPEDWREVMQGLVECARDEIVRCEGMKCREPNCISCNDELEATTSVERSREFVFRARAMLAASQPEVQS